MSCDEAMIQTMFENAKSSSASENLSNAILAHERFVLRNHHSKDDARWQDKEKCGGRLVHKLVIRTNGHADQGVVSEFISDHILHVLKQTQQYQSFQGGTSLMAQALNEACQNIDVDLRAWLEGQNKSVWKGGSTAVMAAISLS